jgi:predicted dehydrogenase
MMQVIQDIRSGETKVTELPAPLAAPGSVLVATAASLVSAGTERYVVELARKNLLQKARERPDHVKRVLQKLRQEGVAAVATQVRAKLAEPMPLGYSGAGVVLECGRGVSEFKPGDRVAVAAPHAEVVSVSRNLCALIPDNVPFDQAAYASVGAIGLEGVRLAKVTLGERVLVIGLGLIGHMVVALLKAQGCRVFGTDVDPKKLELAKVLGADEVGMGSPRDAIAAFTGGQGVDAVIITAATPSNEPIELAADVARVRGRIVLVGVTGLNLPRPPFFMKELEFTVSSSMGPGRTDPVYEDKGIDYPFGHARWTAQRNMSCILDVISAGKLPVDKLTTHRFAIDRAAEAYDLITSKEPFFGIVIEYPDPPRVPTRRLALKTKPSHGELGVSVIGAGNFMRLVMMPLLGKKSDVEWRVLCTAKGMNAVTTGQKYGFAVATSDVKEVFADPQTKAVVVATRHDLHAELVIAALEAGKHVFVEKPLCILPAELEAIRRTVEKLGSACPLLMVGFNRRFAPGTALLQDHFRGAAPLSVSYRFAPGAIPKEAWPQDEDIGGGRLVGEACHAIDTVTAIVGSPPMRVFAESVVRSGTADTSDDRVFLSMRHEDGSISNISYQAGGDRGAPVERIEVFGGGRTGFVEDWDRVELWSNGKSATPKGGKEKGHASELDAFLVACRRGGAWPIPWEHLYGVTAASMGAVRSLREGLPIRLDRSDRTGRADE